MSALFAHLRFVAFGNKEENLETINASVTSTVFALLFSSTTAGVFATVNLTEWLANDCCANETDDKPMANKKVTAMIFVDAVMMLFLII